MEVRECHICHEILEISNFHKYKTKPVMWMCIPCEQEYNRKRDNKRRKSTKRIESVKNYLSKQEVKDRIAKLQKKYRKIPHLIPHHEARSKARSAIRKGIIKESPCEICGEIKVDAHHDDYDKPLEIRWLCRKHHSEHHKERKNALLSKREGVI